MFDEIKAFTYFVSCDDGKVTVFQTVNMTTGTNEVSAIHFALAQIDDPYHKESVVTELQMPGSVKRLFGITTCNTDGSFYVVIPNKQLIDLDVLQSLYEIATNI